MKLRLYVVGLVLTVAAIVFLRRNHQLTATAAQPGVATAVPGGRPIDITPPLTNPSAEMEAPTPTAETAAATPSIQTEMETVKFFLRDFRASLGQNPVGNNAEITKALMGANRTKTKFVVPGDSHVNANGELCDPWGTPYFFHALSATVMEIRTAGPDKRMWTADDIVLR